MTARTSFYRYLSGKAFIPTTISGYITERRGVTKLPFLSMLEFISHFLCTAQPEVFAESFIWVRGGGGDGRGAFSQLPGTQYV